MMADELGEAAGRARRLARRRARPRRRTRWPPTAATSGATPRSCAARGETDPARIGEDVVHAYVRHLETLDRRRRPPHARGVVGRAGGRGGAVVPPVLRAGRARRARPEPGGRRAAACRPGIPKALDEDEVDRLLHAVTGDEPLAQRDRALLELLYGTGIRISEAVGLDLDDLDLDDGTLRVLGKGSKERVVPDRPRRADARSTAYLARRPARAAQRPGARARRATPTRSSSTRAAGASRASRAGRSSAGPASGSGSTRTCRRTSCGTRARPTCSTTAPTCGSCRSCSGTRASRPRRCTRRCRRSGCAPRTTSAHPRAHAATERTRGGRRHRR